MVEIDPGQVVVDVEIEQARQPRLHTASQGVASRAGTRERYPVQLELVGRRHLDKSVVQKERHVPCRAVPECRVRVLIVSIERIDVGVPSQVAAIAALEVGSRAGVLELTRRLEYVQLVPLL